MTAKKEARSRAATSPKARLGIWTPWAQVLCMECEYAGLKVTLQRNPGAHQVITSRFKRLASVSRPKKVSQPDVETLLGTCDDCGCTCWVPDDVALLQRIGRKVADLGCTRFGMEQTGGMCAALSFETKGCRILITAMDGGFVISEQLGERGDPGRSWESDELYDFEVHDWKAEAVLVSAIEECARKALEFAGSLA